MLKNTLLKKKIDDIFRIQIYLFFFEFYIKRKKNELKMLLAYK